MGKETRLNLQKKNLQAKGRKQWQQKPKFLEGVSMLESLSH